MINIYFFSNTPGRPSIHLKNSICIRHKLPTMKQNQVNDEEYTKPSQRKQWHEKSYKPIAIKSMDSDEIEEHRLNLVASYQCNDNEIAYEFIKIQDENDEDRDDCLWLIYKLNSIRKGKLGWHPIYSLKVPIPEEIRAKAANLRRERMTAAKNRNKNATVAPLEVAEEPVKRLLRKPIKVNKK